MGEKTSIIKCENEQCVDIVDIRCFKKRCGHLRIFDENVGKWCTLGKEK